MKRFLQLISVVSFGLLVLLFAGPEKAQAQAPRGGTDTILFMAATRGNDYNGDSLHEWCWKRQDTGEVWHGRFQNGLDELPQMGPYQPPPTDPAVYCPSSWTEKVDLTTYGTTDVPDCTGAFPCASLRTIGKTGTYSTDGCDFIEVDFYDRATWSDITGGDWKGKQRMLHALAPSGPGTSFDLPDVVVTSLGWYSTTEIGTVTGNWACFGFTNYHVHHDFMQPTGSQYCLLNKNNNLLQLNANWQKENNAHWVHSLVHAFGTACLVPGPQAADFLLASGGPMEGTGVPGEPTRKLAAGEIPSIAASTCFAGTTWCGTLTVTQPVLLAAYIYWLNTYGIQPSTSGYVYGPDADADYIRIGFHHYGGYQNTPPAYYSLYIRSAQAGWVIIDPQGSPVASGGNAPGESGCLGCAEEGFAIDWYPSVSPAPAITGYQAQWPTSVGGNPTQQQANQWVQDRISQGHWNDSASALKSALDAAIRPASNLRGMHSSGITESPSFDGRLWE